MGTTMPGVTEIGTDWRVVDGVATASFDAPSPIEGAALAGRIGELSGEIVVDLRATGMRVRLDSDEHAEAVSAVARDLGLAANPAVLQHLSVVFESANPTGVRRFWQRVLDYAPGEDGGLADPLRRDPGMRIRQSTEPRPLRNRIHLDVVLPAAAWSRRILVGIRTAGVCHTNPDGDEVDGCRARRSARRSGQPTGGGVQRDGVLPHHLADAAADLAAARSGAGRRPGFPLLVDLRPGLVIIDSGKDEGGRRPRPGARVHRPRRETSRPLHANSAPLRIRGCRASLSSSSTPPTSPRSARSGSPHSDTPTTGEAGSATSTIRGG